MCRTSRQHHCCPAMIIPPACPVQVALQGGDELTLIASTCYSFVYKSSDDGLQPAAAQFGAEADAAPGEHLFADCFLRFFNLAGVGELYLIECPMRISGLMLVVLQASRRVT